MQSEQEVNVDGAEADEEFMKSFEVTLQITEQQTTTTVVGKDEKKEGLFSKLTKKVTSTLFSAETESALGETMELLKILLKDLKFQPIDITIALAWMSMKHQTDCIRTEKGITNAEQIKNLLHFMRFASAAYGWKLIYGYAFKNKTKGVIDGIKMNDAANVKALLEHTGIKEQDIIETRWTSTNAFAPGHFIAVDHATKSIIIAIRGTFHLRDAATDLAARYVPCKGGNVHSGMLNAAKAKQAEMMPTIATLAMKHPGYKLTIVGHSLGAGTASLLAFLLKEENNLDVICYAFAPPCVMSLDLATQCKSYITSVVLNDDIVPRLSFGSIHDLKVTLQHLLSKNDTKVQRMFQIMTAGNQFGESATQKMAKYLKCNASSDPLPKRTTMSDRLYPPGSIFYIYSAKNGIANYDTCEESHPSLFSDIVMSYSMYTDHLPDCYENAFKRTIERIEKGSAIVTTVTHQKTVTEGIETIEDKDHHKTSHLVTVVEEKDIVKQQVIKNGKVVEEVTDYKTVVSKDEGSMIADSRTMKVPSKLPPKK